MQVLQTGFVALYEGRSPEIHKVLYNFITTYRIKLMLFCQSDFQQFLKNIYMLCSQLSASYITPCKRSDPNVNECAKKQASVTIPHILKGKQYKQNKNLEKRLNFFPRRQKF